MVTKLKYIWSDRRYLVNRRAEQVLRWLVWRLPKVVVMWCYIRVGAHATTGQYGNTVVTDLTMMEALKRWDERAVEDDLLYSVDQEEEA